MGEMKLATMLDISGDLHALLIWSIIETNQINVKHSVLMERPVRRGGPHENQHDPHQPDLARVVLYILLYPKNIAISNCSRQIPMNGPRKDRPDSIIYRTLGALSNSGVFNPPVMIVHLCGNRFTPTPNRFSKPLRHR